MSDQSQTKTPRRLRLQFDARPNEQNLLEQIKRRTGVRTYSEVLRMGLRVLNRLLEYKEEGYSVIVAKNGNATELELLL
jgi:hypothetical protein